MDATVFSMTDWSVLNKAKAVIHLTRWREHLPYTIPLVVGGAMIAKHVNNAQLDWRLLLVIIASIFAQSFAYMINDLVDAPDDALDPKKKQRNPISNGTLTYRQGMIVTWGTFLISLGLFAISGLWAFIMGGLMLALSYLYSAPPFRWKARPITDVLSHALMLSALLVMVGFFTFSATPNIAWFAFASAFFFSAYGQFFNQVDDYVVDKAAGLRNTVVLLGIHGTKALMYASITLAAVFLCLSILSGVFPNWLASIALISIFATTLFTWETDMRGNKAEGSGVVQKPGLLMFNIVMLTWWAQSVGLFVF